MTREEYKAIVFADLQPLFDACLELPYDEDRDAYHIQDDDLFIRTDGRIYNSNFFIEDGYTVQQFVKEQLAPRVKIVEEENGIKYIHTTLKVEFESFEDGKEIKLMSGEYHVTQINETFIPTLEPLKDGNYILVNAGKNQWLNDRDRIFFTVENGKIKLNK